MCFCQTERRATNEELLSISSTTHSLHAWCNKSCHLPFTSVFYDILNKLSDIRTVLQSDILIKYLLKLRNVYILMRSISLSRHNIPLNSHYWRTSGFLCFCQSNINILREHKTRPRYKKKRKEKRRKAGRQRCCPNTVDNLW